MIYMNRKERREHKGMSIKYTSYFFLRALCDPCGHSFSTDDPAPSPRNWRPTSSRLTSSHGITLPNDSSTLGQGFSRICSLRHSRRMVRAVPNNPLILSGKTGALAERAMSSTPRRISRSSPSFVSPPSGKMHTTSPCFESLDRLPDRLPWLIFPDRNGSIHPSEKMNEWLFVKSCGYEKANGPTGRGKHHQDRIHPRNMIRGKQHGAAPRNTPAPFKAQTV